MTTMQIDEAVARKCLAIVDRGSSTAAPKVGDFVVRQDRWHVIAHQVRKVTARQYVASGRYSSRDQRYDFHSVVFAGPEAIALKLREQLTSSDALESQEREAANDRRRKRDDKYIRSAITAAVDRPEAAQPQNQRDPKP